MRRFVLPLHSHSRIALRKPLRASPTPWALAVDPSTMANKRKRSTGSSAVADERSSKTEVPRPRQRTAVPLPANPPQAEPPPPRRQSTRTASSAITNPDVNPDVVDGLSALRASPDGGEIPDIGPAVKVRNGKSIGADVSVNGDLASQEATCGEAAAATETMSTTQPSAEGLGRGHGRSKGNGPGVQKHASAAPAPADVPDKQPGRNRSKPSQHVKVDSADANNTAVNASGDILEHDVGVTGDAEADGALIGQDGLEDEEEVKEALSRPPPVNSDYLPLPWKGRLGYVRTLHTLTTHIQANGGIGVPEHLLA
jgi:UV DNA damage endonuclease